MSEYKTTNMDYRQLRKGFFNIILLNNIPHPDVKDGRPIYPFLSVFEIPILMYLTIHLKNDTVFVSYIVNVHILTLLNMNTLF